jgi:hypothetical protein
MMLHKPQMLRSNQPSVYKNQIHVQKEKEEEEKKKRDEHFAKIGERNSHLFRIPTIATCDI